MVTGASTADLGLVLVDARQGLTEQSRRHAVLLSLLRVPHLVLAINKMDLVDWSEEVYERIHAEFTQFATKLSIPDLEVIPISALKGDNVVTRSRARRGTHGPHLMHHLEHVPWPPTATWSTSDSRCSSWCVPSPTSTTTTAGTPGRWPAACSNRAMR
ncbi:MAG: GTP-binding protein [Nocardioides sp.]